MKEMKKIIAKQLSKLVEPKTNGTDEEVTTFKWWLGSVKIPKK